MRTLKADRRSQRTWRILHDALIALMQEKRYDSITVQDIIDQANVGRSTFYAHFQDKEDLAVSMLVHMLDMLTQTFEESASADKRFFPTLELFRHVQENHAVFKALMGGHGMDLFFQKGQIYWSQRIEAHFRARFPEGQEFAVPLPVICSYIAGAFVVMLKWWLDNKLPYSPERMDEIVHQLMMSGVQSALGVEQTDQEARANP
jgi:AcrR family transcriptional regulator